MRPAAGSKEYLGRADHLQSKQTKPIGPLRANSAEELVQQLKNAIDTGRGSNPITTGRVTIFFNSNLAKEVIGHGGNIYADIEKHGNTPLLLLSAEDQGGMQLAVDRSSTVQKSKEGHVGSQAFQFPAEKAKAMGLTLARYAVGSPVDYAPGITAIPLEFRSEVYPGETIKIGEPGVTVSPPKMGQTMESSNDPVAIDSTSPVGGNVQEGRLQVGDPVIVTAPNAYEGKTGEIAEFSPSGKFVIVDLYNHGRHSMHLSDVEYNQYADDQDADEYSDDKIDEDTGPSPVASAITRRILQQRLDLLKQYGPELVGSAVDEVADYVGDVEEIGSSDVSAWVNQVERMLKENPPEAFAEEAHMYRGPHGHADVDRKGGVTRVTRRDWDDTSKATTDVKGGKYFPNKDIKGQGTGSVASNGTSSLNSIPGGSYRKTPRLDHDANDAPNYDVDEGFQDFNKVEPYAVCLAGKPVKQFDYYEDARRFHDNWKKKLYREGNTEKADKITLMPLNLDEEEQKPYNPNEFRPVGPITIVPPKKLKSGETHQGINDYWKAHGQAPIYKTNEMDKSQTPPGRAGDYPLGVKGTTGKPVTAKKVVKDLTKDLNQAFSKEKKVKEAGNPAQQAAIAIAKKKEQGVAEGSLDEVSRRGFLKGLGAAAVAGAAGGVKANNSHLDYEWDQLTSPVDKTIYEMLNLYFLCKNEPKMIGDDCDKVKSLISKFVADPKNKQIVNKLYGSVVRDNTKMGKKFNQPYDTVTLWHEYGKRRNEIMKNFSALSPEFESVQQGVAEGYADQQRKIFKKNGEPVGEVGIDRESSPGNGQWYMKCYAYNIDNAGYDSYEEAVAELKHCLKQGVAEGFFDRFKKSKTLPEDPRLKPALAQAKSENKWIDPFTWHQAWFYSRVLTDMNAEEAMAEYDRKHQGNMGATNPDPDTWKIAFNTQRQKQGVAEASYINGHVEDPKSLRWKQTSMSYEQAVAKFGKNNVKQDGKNRLGQKIVMVLVPLGEQGVAEGYTPDTNYSYTIVGNGDESKAYDSKEEAQDAVRKLGAGYKIKRKPRTSARSVKKHFSNRNIDEESSTSSEAVEIALIRRVLVAHTDLIMNFGLDKVTQAIEEVAYNVGDVDEIGTSDVSGWIHQVKQILGAE